MVKGSQLAQLKTALSEAGLSRKSQPQTSRKKRKRSRAGPLKERDKEKAVKKLREIHERLNPFDVKVTKLKHDVGGRKLKGVTGRPGLSKQVGIEQRKKTLLVEYEQKSHTGGIVDRRFGENDPTMTPEERMLERFTRERQRASKGVTFNLDDEDDLTHYGQSLSAMDDFDGVGLGLDDDEDAGQIDNRTVKKTHFGGFEDENETSDDEVPAGKKSKSEVMAEIITKSKEHKYQRQMEKDEDENTRYQLDQEFDSIRNLLFELDPAATGSNSVPLGRVRPGPSEGAHIEESNDQDYDQFVRELAFEKRAKPKDRTKTEEELAMEEKEALEKAEKARLRRMMGIEDDSDDGDEGHKGRKRKRERERDGSDDFVNEDVLVGLGEGLVSGRSQDRGENVGESESDCEETDTDIAEEGEENSSSDDDPELEHHTGGLNDALPLEPSRKRAQKGKQRAESQDLPFTFPCPETHDKFLSIIEDINHDSIPTVVQRIRSLYHPSLSKDNPAKLQAFIGVLVDHVLHAVSPPTPQFALLDALVPHVYGLSKIYPVASAQAFVDKIVLMHKNLMRGLSKGATSLHSKTWPGTAELGFLRITGAVWSTSDMNHAVISPARLLMGEYLGLGRVRSIMDLASGLFLCTMFLQFEGLSKRLIPETINFLLNTVLHIAPHPFESTESLPGSFPAPDFDNDALSTLKLSREAVEVLEVSCPDLVAILCERDSSTAQSLLGLLDTAFQLLGKFAEIYKSLDGFIELYTPVLEILQNLALDGFPKHLQQRQSSLQGIFSRLLKFSGQSRRPLLLQAHKPIPIPSYVPKFSMTSSNFLRHQDPDQERAALAKLRSQVRQERKGAIRELRKDSRFLAAVQQKRQTEEAKGYAERMKKVFGSIEGERAEQKAMDREKTRQKKRAGHK